MKYEIGAKCNKGQNNVIRATNVMGIGHKDNQRRFFALATCKKLVANMTIVENVIRKRQKLELV